MEFDANKLKNNDNYCDESVEINNKLNYLRKFRANILVRSYIDLLINNLYIEIDTERRGYAKEMVNKINLLGYCWESTESIIPFFKANDEIIRGILNHYKGGILEHSWIKFNLKNKEYVFDPCLNVIVLKEIYDKVFTPVELSHIDAKKVRDDMIATLTNSQISMNGMHIITYNYDINDSFYKTKMSVSGQAINKKILCLRTKFDSE